MENNIYTCIDIGSYEIKLLVCHLREERLFVLSQKTVRSIGIERGQITNFDKLVGQIKKVKELAELDCNKSLKNLILTVPPISVAVEPVMGRINLDVKQPVDSRNVRQLFRQVMEQPFNEKYLPIGLIPRVFRIDENQIVQNPRGLTGVNLGIDAQRILAPATLVSNLVHVVESSGFKVEEIVVGSISETLLSLTTPEMFARTCHINIGHSMTTLTVVNDGKILHVRSSSIGGRDITRALSEKFKISEKVADELKINYGKILIHEADAINSQVIYVDDTGEEVNFITRGMMNEVVTDWTIKLFSAIKDHIVTDLRLKEEEYHYALAGGMAELPNIIYALQNQLPMPATIERPIMLGVRDSKFSVLVGSAIFAHELKLLLGREIEEEPVALEVPIEEESIEADILNDFIPLNEKISPTLPSEELEKPQSLKDAIAGMSISGTATAAKPKPKTKLVDTAEETTIKIPIVGEEEFFHLNDKFPEVTDDYIDEKLGSSGVLVRFLDKIFNENEEEA